MPLVTRLSGTDFGSVLFSWLNYWKAMFYGRRVRSTCLSLTSWQYCILTSERCRHPETRHTYLWFVLKLKNLISVRWVDLWVRLTKIITDLASRLESNWGRLYWHMPLIPALGKQRQGESLWVKNQPGLQSEFQDSQRCTVKPYLKRKKKCDVGKKWKEGSHRNHIDHSQI